MKIFTIPLPLSRPPGYDKHSVLSRHLLQDLNKCSITYKNKDEDGINFILNEKDYEKAKLFSEDIIFTITEEDIEDKNKNIIRDDQNNKHYYGGIAYYSFHNQDKNDSIKMLNSPIINTSNEKNTKITYKNKGKKDEDDSNKVQHKQNMCMSELNYIEDTFEVYANLFELKLKKDLFLYQYPFEVESKIEASYIYMHKKLFRAGSQQLKQIYGECFVFGDSLYGIKKVEEPKSVKVSIYLNGKNDYILIFQKFTN